MGLAGRHTPALTNWDACEFVDDFIGNDPVTSGFYSSGVLQACIWLPGPAVGTLSPNVTQCSGVTFQAQSGAVFGQAVLGSPATANAEGTAFVNRQAYTLVSGGTLYGRYRVRADEVTTSGALSFGVGFVSAPFQSGIIPTGGGVRASGNAFLVGKTSGQQNWAMMANVQGSGLTVQTTTNCGGNQSGNFYDVELFINPERGSIQYTAKVNGAYLKQATTAFANPAFAIVMEFPQDSTPMSPLVGIRQGAGEAATLTVDKAYAQQSRTYP